jgi:uracil-DNA glycosylase family 4
MKLIAYQALVEKRKNCTRCMSMGLTNPASAELCHLDSNQIGPWTRWQGDLDADIMVVGQDWGDVTSFKHQSGIDNDSRTNRLLRELLAYVGINVSAPPAFSRQSNVFLTNSVLCLKGGNCQSQVSSHWYNNCGTNFLRPQIEIVQPKVVVAMGEWAYRTIMRSFNLFPLRFRKAVEAKGHVLLLPGTLLIPVYHCSPRILNTHRDREQQFVDWNRIQYALNIKFTIITNVNNNISLPAPVNKIKGEESMGKISERTDESNIKVNQRYRFMQQLLERCAKKTNMFINDSPYSYQNWVATVAGKSGLMWQFTVLENYARTEFWLCSTKSAEINFRRFELIKKQKEYIEKSLGETLMWDFKEARKYQCIRYYCSIGGFKDESKWYAIQEDMIDHLLKMESLFKDIINQLE